jgi:hypothetical protein
VSETGPHASARIPMRGGLRYAFTPCVVVGEVSQGAPGARERATASAASCSRWHPPGRLELSWQVPGRWCFRIRRSDARPAVGVR